MGIGWIYFKELERLGVFGGGGKAVLDIGAQNIFDIPLDEGVEYALRHGSPLGEAELRRRMAALVRRSPWPKGEGKSVYLGEFLALTTMSYLGLDIFPAPGCEIFGLTYQRLSAA